MVKYIPAYPILVLWLCTPCIFTASHATADDAYFPFGIFDKSDPYGHFDEKDFDAGSARWKQYRKQITELFVDHNINTIIGTKYLDDDHARYAYDLLHDKGIRVIHTPTVSFKRGSATLKPGHAPDSIYRHPAIIAFKLGNEPKDETKLKRIERKTGEIRKHYKKPVLTAMIGEIMGENTSGVKLLLKGNTSDFSKTAWQRLEPEIIFARHYTFRRQYDLINWYKEKMKMPFAQWCEHMESAFEGKPWWFIPQLFGKGKEKSRTSYWRFPTSAELNAQVHTALANGARGIIGWGMPSYDVSRKSRRTLLTNPDLEPEVARDGSVPLEQYGIIGALVAKHAGLLNHHDRARLQVTGENDEIIEIPRKDDDDQLYIYSVNLNAEIANRERLLLPAGIDAAEDIYSGTKLKLDSSKDGSILEYELEPGAACFIKLHGPGAGEA